MKLLLDMPVSFLLLQVLQAYGHEGVHAYQIGKDRASRQPRLRYALIDHRGLMDLLGIPSMALLQRSHRSWVEESLSVERGVRESKWSESVAVGNKGFVAIDGERWRPGEHEVLI